MTEIKAPYNVFFGEDGYPLEGGYIFIGLDGLNPLSNPQQAYWDPALTIPAANVRTSAGRPSNNGVIGRLYVPGDYSILVQDKNGRTIYSQLSVTFENSDLLVTESSGTLTRAARQPSSFNINNIRDTGFYAWTNGATTNHPAASAPGDVFLLEVVSSPAGAGSLVQILTDATLDATHQPSRFVRLSIDDGTTWSAWASNKAPYIDILTLLDNMGLPAATLEYNDVDGTVDVVIGSDPPFALVGGEFAYEAGDNVRFPIDTIASGFTSGTYARVTNYWVAQKKGTVRVKYSVKRHRSTGTAYASVYKNDIAVGGSEISNAAIGTWTTGSVDVSVVPGDTISVWGRAVSCNGAVGFCRVCTDHKPESAPMGRVYLASDTDDTQMILPPMDVGVSVHVSYYGAPSTGIAAPSPTGIYGIIAVTDGTAVGTARAGSVTAGSTLIGAASATRMFSVMITRFT